MHNKLTVLIKEIQRLSGRGHSLLPKPNPPPSASSALDLWCTFQMDWTPALVNSWICACPC